jgi:hypothetical protein
MVIRSEEQWNDGTIIGESGAGNSDVCKAETSPRGKVVPLSLTSTPFSDVLWILPIYLTLEGT